ncbi:MAG: primosomal protein N' [Pseudomonadota bacterium]
MPGGRERYIAVAVPVPLYGTFDYAVPEGMPMPAAGCRLQVTFGRRRLIGVCLGTLETPATPLEKIRPIEHCLDERPLLDEPLMEWLQRASHYYHHPIGEVWATALPNALMQGRAIDEGDDSLWQLTQAVTEQSLDELKRAPKQRAVAEAFFEASGVMDAGTLAARFDHWRPAVTALVDKGWLAPLDLPPERPGRSKKGPELNPEQRQVVDALSMDGGFQPALLRGVTGSGKTEVYFHWIDQCLAADKQVLFLVPEIGLTPQLVARFAARFDVLLVTLHSGMTDLERLRAWRLARSGRAHIVLGTRSALFAPIPRLGMIVVDEEHDASLKQQEGFRYHARDLAVLRARAAAIPIVLGTATPSFETHHNARQGRYLELRLNQRAGGAKPPIIRMIDARQHRPASPLSHSLDRAVEQHLAADGQVLLFLNRRGYAPTLFCPQCGWHADCQRCDAHMTLHFQPSVLRCHHCGSESRPPPHCPDCGHRNLQHQGQGTEQLELFLKERYPKARTMRIDRDNTRRRGELERRLAAVERGEANLLIGTQILAKGHHFPGVTLVGVLDCDRGLFSADFKATEQMAQLILQVAGRAGRAERPGEVMIQSTQPDHPLMHSLVTRGYEAFTERALAERRVMGLPPYRFAAMLRAESVERQAAMGFLEMALALEPPAGVEVLGPIPSPMERRAGRFRAQAMILSEDRKVLHQFLSVLIRETGKNKKTDKARWSLDVDPVHAL